MLSANGMNGRRKIRSLIETWVRFGEFLKTSLGKEGVQKAQEEEFLRLKAKIAHLLPVLTVIEKGGSIDPEALAAVRDITQMLNSFATLATPEPLTAEQTEEIISQWHTIFIFLNKLEGALKDRRYGFVGRGSTAAQEGSFGHFFGSRLVRFLLSLVVVIAGVVLIAGLLDIDLEDARDAFDRGGSVILGREAASTETGSSRADTTAATDSVAAATTGAGEAAPKGRGIAPAVRRTIGAEQESIVPSALRPLVRQYGKHLTMIVFAVFLAGVVFLFFVRVK
ncbi:MAG: hypothetical protein JSW03_09155 [Candidatus Eiseniibacteriota bacterium]|nr:MAG: hypothetical protein JSW03_09155 [Candidatus Eisenbacteria bacterium]